MSDFTIEKAEAALKQRKTSIPKTAVCPCCANIFDSHDSPAEYARVTKWSAARELGKLNRGHRKSLTPEQRQAKARVLAVNRKPWQFEVGYSYPSSPNAVALGFAKVGCWTVSKRRDPLKPWQAVKGFVGKAEAEAYMIQIGCKQHAKDVDPPNPIGLELGHGSPAS